MKHLYFVFAAAAGAAFAAGGADAATRYGSSGAKQRQELYQNYTGCSYGGCKNAPAPAAVAAAPEKKPEPVKKSATKTPRAPNKQTLPDPFFQPLSGYFGLLSDIGYASNSYDFKIAGGTGPWSGITGDWKASEFFVKEDLFVGISDEVAILGMFKYANTKYKMGWDPFYDNLGNLHPASLDRAKDSGIAIWGLGLQWKFYEDSEWVANASGLFQSADTANNIMLTGKAGYKLNSDTTIYGLANLAYVMWDDKSYGNGIMNNAGQVAYLAFSRDSSKSIYFEGGAGVFHKLSDQWSVDLEGVLGRYDWHTQFYAKAALFWQPNDNFALGGYVRGSLFDTADSAKDLYLYSWCDGSGTQCYADAIANGIADPLAADCKGQALLDKYQDLQIGLNAIIYF